MSVETRRFAAAQRTAAGTTSRRRRLAAWIVIVPTLSMFSFSVIAGAAGFATKANVPAAAAKVVQPAKAGDGVLVQVETSNTNPLENMFGRDHGKEVCWISNSQLARVTAAFHTSTSSLTVGGETYSLVDVYGTNDHDLRQVLASPVKCRLVEVAHVFYLPFDANLS